MATDPEQIIEDEQIVNTETAPDVAEQEQPDPVADLAKQMGWRPKEQFKGIETDWKPADQFILASKDIQSRLSRELREVKGTVENISRTSARMFEQQLDAERVKLAGMHERAVEDGDAAAAMKISRAMDKLTVADAPKGPPVEAQEFAERHAGWFNKDLVATRRAAEVAQTYADAGRSVPEQLEAAESTIKREYPHLFAKPPPQVSAPQGRTPGTSQRGKTVNDLPKAARDIAEDMVARGLIPNTDAYTRNYFAVEGKGK